jgi:hypothetical protein
MKWLSFAICLCFSLINIPFVIQGSLVNAFALGWSLAFVFVSVMHL